jgi:small nuclear ribonucleoprotein (snRNP)-like protein
MNSIRVFLFVSLVAASTPHSFAQEKVDPENYRLDVPNAPSGKKEEKRHAKVTLINGEELKGTLISIGDNFIQLENVVYKNSKGGNPDPQKTIPFNEINYKDIEYISIRGTLGKTIKGFFLGIGGGLLVGIGIGGGLLCNDCDFESLLVASGLFGSIGAVLGGPVGAISAVRETFVIEGKVDNFGKFKNKMKGKTMKKSRRR